jgi:hypothetical protein
MRLADITNYPRGWDSSAHPVVAHIEIPASRLPDFETRAADQTQIRILGHDYSDNEFVIVHVGCASEKAKRRLEQWWT